MLKKIVLAIVLIGILIGVFRYLLIIGNSRTFQFFGGLTASVQTNKKIVALTFDDAPSQYCDEVLQILEKKHIKATFYVVGSNGITYPTQLAKIIQSGHEIGNHSYTHPRIVFKSLSFIDSQIQKTNEVIRKAGYTKEITFRPPNGKKLILLPWYLKSHDIKTIMWNVEPDTYVQNDSSKILRYVLENVKPGSIILMHPFCKGKCRSDRIALPAIIDGLREQGYEFMTISDLLKNDSTRINR